MLDQTTIQAKNAELCHLAHEKFGVRSVRLDKAIRKLGRRLPSRLRQKAAILIEAEQLAGHPKLAMAIDRTQVDAAYMALRNHLNGIDVQKRRKDAILNRVADIAWKLILIFTVVIAVLNWRGYL